MVHKKTIIPKEVLKYKNEELPTSYIYTREMWDINEINIHNEFSFTVATEIANYFEPQTIDKKT